MRLIRGNSNLTIRVNTARGAASYRAARRNAAKAAQHAAAVARGTIKKVK